MDIITLKVIKNQDVIIADREHKDYLVNIKTGEIRRYNGEDAMPSCLNQGDKDILVYRNCKYCDENKLSL